MSLAKVDQLAGNGRIKAVTNRQSIAPGDVIRLGLVTFL